MYETLKFISDYIIIFSVIIYIWFAIDCKRYNRILTSKFDWFCYMIHSVFMVYGFYCYKSYDAFLFEGLV